MDTAYLLLLPLVLFAVLLTHVWLQNPRGRPNRLFALYMLDLLVAAGAALVMSTSPAPLTAAAAAVATMATVFCLNTPFLIGLVLALFYPRHLLRWYGLPLVMGLGVLWAVAGIVDAALDGGLFFTMSAQMGQGYVPREVYMGGLLALPLRIWFLGGIAAALGLLVAARWRAPREQRAPVTWLIVVLLVSGAVTPLLPSHPLVPILNPLLFALAFALIVGRYSLFLPAEATMLAVFRSTGSGLLVCDRAGTLQYLNPAAEELTGVPAGQALGRPLWQTLEAFFAGARQEGGETALLDALREGLAQPVEALLHVTTPGRRILAVSGIPIDDGRGRHLGYVLSLRDVTEREQVQQALAERARMAETIRQLSTPTVPVMPGILILPLVGAIDSERARDVMQDMLAAIRRHRARAILIDITGVPLVDTQVANYLMRALRAANLLGCQGILVGIRAEIARTIIELGIDLQGLVIRGSLQDGLQYALDTFGPGSGSAGPARRGKASGRQKGQP